MTKKRSRRIIEKPKRALPAFIARRLNESSFILLLTVALLLLLSLWTYDVNDPSWFQVAKNNPIKNAGGQLGAYIAASFYFLFGYVGFLFPLSCVYFAWCLLKETHDTQATQHHSTHWLRFVGFFVLLLSATALLNLELADSSLLLYHPGGIVGFGISNGICAVIGLKGAILFLFAGLLTGVTLLTGLSWIQVIESVGYATFIFFEWIAQQGLKSVQWLSHKRQAFQNRPKKITLKPTSLQSQKTKQEEPSIAAPKIDTPPSKNEEEVALNPKAVAVVKPNIEPKEALRPVKPSLTQSNKGLPALNLLNKNKQHKALGGYTHQELETLSREVEQHLLDFGIQADVVAVHPGPVITRFELQLAAGVKVSRLSALAKDLARSLSVTSVRVVEVIPGKTVVGLELPNQQRDVVCLYEVLSSSVYQQAHSPLTLALGVDIAGYPMVVDLAKMPHLLVAGTTGSGKSVGINSMILSLLFKASPEEVRLILIDPKMLELSVYDAIPHLLTPVVTDMKEAASSLRWCVEEMERRYRLMAALGVRNLAGFNIKINEAIKKGEPLLDPTWKPTGSLEETAPYLHPLPYIVVIIDELADMMMVVGKKVEQLIARIAQKARAAGIHLILATQRPSVDVLTGLIKSNIPTRMSFQVSSKIDSRTILDQQGAEQLLGHGDLLYLAPGTGAPLRVHGAFVDDKEVHRVADDWRSRGEPNYIDAILQTHDASEGGGDDGESEADSDPLYDQAVEFVLQTRKASISALQRRLKIGYNRSARLIDEMERTGLVGPLEGGVREVLVTTITED